MNYGHLAIAESIRLGCYQSSFEQSKVPTCSCLEGQSQKLRYRSPLLWPSSTFGVSFSRACLFENVSLKGLCRDLGETTWLMQAIVAIQQPCF